MLRNVAGQLTSLPGLARTLAPLLPLGDPWTYINDRIFVHRPQTRSEAWWHEDSTPNPGVRLGRLEHVRRLEYRSRQTTSRSPHSRSRRARTLGRRHPGSHPISLTWRIASAGF